MQKTHSWLYIQFVFNSHIIIYICCWSKRIICAMNQTKYFLVFANVTEKAAMVEWQSRWRQAIWDDGATRYCLVSNKPWYGNGQQRPEIRMASRILANHICTRDHTNPIGITLDARCQHCNLIQTETIDHTIDPSLLPRCKCYTDFVYVYATG